VLAECVGPGGRVTAYEVAEALAQRATCNLAVFATIDLRHGDGSDTLGEQWQAVTRLRRDGHDAEPSCWLHRDTCCFSPL
jgi:protein-L-isoaspartate O-methyltransferase